MPLLLCGELETALVHLANSSYSGEEGNTSLDGLCVAVHLALELTKSQMAVMNLESTFEKKRDSSVVPESIVTALVTPIRNHYKCHLQKRHSPTLFKFPMRVMVPLMLHRLPSRFGPRQELN